MPDFGSDASTTKEPFERKFKIGDVVDYEDGNHWRGTFDGRGTVEYVQETDGDDLLFINIGRITNIKAWARNCRPCFERK